MSQDSELSRLERFVEKLLAKYEELRDEKVQLLKTLSERDSLIEELEDNILTNDGERVVISERVNKIVDQIEEWETSLDDDDVEVSEDAEEDDSDETVEAVDSTTDDDEGDASADDAEGDDDGRVQHNLFSLEGSK